MRLFQVLFSPLDTRQPRVIIILALKPVRRSRPACGARKVRAPQGTMLGNAQAG